MARLKLISCFFLSHSDLQATYHLPVFPRSVGKLSNLQPSIHEGTGAGGYTLQPPSVPWAILGGILWAYQRSQQDWVPSAYSCVIRHALLNWLFLFPCFNLPAPSCPASWNHLSNNPPVPCSCSRLCFWRSSNQKLILTDLRRTNMVILTDEDKNWHLKPFHGISS